MTSQWAFSPQHLSKKKNVNLSILSLTDHYLETPVTSPSCEIQELQRWPVSFWETHDRKCNRIASTLSLTIQLSLSFPLSVLNSWSIHSVFPSCAVAAAPWQTVACLSADWQTDGQTVRVSDITSLPWKNKRKPAALWLVKLDVNVDFPPPLRTASETFLRREQSCKTKDEILSPRPQNWSDGTECFPFFSSSGGDGINSKLVYAVQTKKKLNTKVEQRTKASFSVSLRADNRKR